MMTIVGLVNIHHLIQIQLKKKKEKNFLLVMKTLRPYYLNNFPICHTVVLTIVIML